MILVVLVLLLVLIALFTSVQTLYLEGMRLRTRDLPSLQYFKSDLEPRLNLRSEEGALTFSLWKHTCLVFFGVAVLAQVIDGGHLTIPVMLESLIAAWLLLMLCGYLIPQLLFRRTSGHWIAHLMPFYSGAALTIRPLVLALNFLHSLLDITTPEAARDEPATSAENIETLITAGTEEGLIQEDDRKLIQSVVEFGDKVVREIMTARPNMVAIQADEPLEALHRLVVTEQYSRIPAWQSSIDDVIGFVHVRDMFEVPESDRLTRKVRELMRPIRFVPETKPVNDLMREMQQEGAHMVIVVDEYGNTAGLATMEDLVEVILGEIRDEHEPDSDVTEDGKGGYIVSGNFDIARIADLLHFKPDDEIESTTIGGLVTEWLGRVPKPGESIERDGIRVEILASDEMRVEQVRLSAQPEPSPAPESVGAEEIKPQK
ncbi:MAG TPA: hemolysin family protein [Bryobacteraceae bacterium]|jgi:CBS domain containing-hemolysin-like protein|nr:hemolysin family protein [Bryobacteraceae bacterium]